MPKQIVTTVYSFDELSDDAKEKAREWYRNGALDYEWWDAVYDDAKHNLKLIGFKVEKIYFSGFSSQGDGACFTGRWDAGLCDAKALASEVPADRGEFNRELNRIAKALQEIASVAPSATARIAHRGHYYHSLCTEIDFYAEIDDGDDDEASEEIDTDKLEEDFKEEARSAMDWIYRNLEREYEWLLSDEQVDESIKANEYTFDEDGNRDG